MTLIYATAADLQTWTGAPPDDPAKATALLRRASFLVGRAIRNDLYDVTPSGIPADPDLSDAVRDATCAQVEVWLEGGLNVIAGPGGQPALPTVSAIDGAQVSFDAYLTAAARTGALTQLDDVALHILRAAGLATGVVQ